MPADNREPGLPLGYFLKHHPEAGALVICDACQRGNRYELPAVVARLATRGIENPERLGIRAISALVRAPCPQCRGRSFSTRPDWPLHRLPHMPATLPS